MSSKVNVETVQMPAGINLPNSVIVQGGVDGPFFPANQIGWGKSTFMNSEFGGTSDGLLNLIENVITEDERVIAKSLTNLNTRTLNTITSYTAADENLSTRIDDLENLIGENEEIIASSLTDLNTRTLNTITSYTAADENLSTRIDDLENAGYTTMTDVENYISTNIPISSKQDIITDLETIRAGAAKGATALQSVPNEYVTETELNNKGYLTEHQDISGKANIDDVPTKISELENDKGYLVKVILTQAEYDALETKDANTLYAISDTNETVDTNFITKSQLDSRGFLTQTDKSELSAYDQVLLGKITELESKLTAALNRITTLETEMQNTLSV